MVSKEYFRRGKQCRDGHFQRYWYAFSKRFRNPVISEDKIRAVKPSDLGRGFEVIPPDLVEGFANDFIQDELPFLVESRPGISEGNILAERDRFIKDGIEKIPKPQLRDLIERHRVVQRQRALAAEIEERAERKRKPWEKSETEWRPEKKRMSRREAKKHFEELRKEADTLKELRLSLPPPPKPVPIPSVVQPPLIVFGKPESEVRLPALLKKMKELEEKG